jgi:hypothetical protein
MLPIVNTFRSGNISANAVDKYFGDLRDIINNRDKIVYIGIMLIGLCFMVEVGRRVKNILSDNSKVQKSAYTSKASKMESLLESDAWRG